MGTGQQDKGDETQDTTHDIASGQNLFLRGVFRKTTTIATRELSGSSREMVTLIRREVKIKGGGGGLLEIGSILASD